MSCRFNSPIGENENNELAVLLDSSVGLTDQRDSVGMITSEYEDELVYGTPTIGGITGSYPYPRLRSVGRWANYDARISAGGTTVATVGNGQFSGRYIVLGDTCFFSAAYFFNSTTSFGATGPLHFNIPIQPRTDGVSVNENPFLGQIYCFDASTLARNVFGLFGSTASPFSYSIRGARLDGTALTESSPWGWANGDKIAIAGSYRCSGYYQGS